MEQALKKGLNHYQEQFQERKVQMRMDLSTSLPLVLMDEDKVSLLLENLNDPPQSFLAAYFGIHRN